jgi:hypothetical protein
LTTEEQLASQLATSSLYYGINLQTLITLHSALILGRVPVLIGDDVDELCRHYSMTVSSGQISWVSVSPSVVDPQDLLGRYDASIRRIVPHPTGILHAVKSALASDTLSLLVLEGFNRAPVEAYLQPILAAAAASRIGDDSRVVRIADLSIVSKSDPYAQVAEFAWPSNLLLLCIPTSGSTTLPISKEMWRYFSVIDTTGARVTNALGLTDIQSVLGKPEVTALGFEAWTSLVDSNRATIDTNDDAIKEFASRMGLVEKDLRAVSELKGMLLRNGIDEDANSLALITTLLPFVHASEAEIAEAIALVQRIDASKWKPTYEFVAQSRT